METRSAAPNDTHRLLTGAIFEHFVTADAGDRWDRYHLDAAWQWRLFAAHHVGQGALLDGEYSTPSRGRCASERLQLCFIPPSRLTVMQVNQARRSTADNDEKIVVVCLTDF